MKCKHEECHYWLYYKYDKFEMEAESIIGCQTCFSRIPPDYIPEYQHVAWIHKKYNIGGNVFEKSNEGETRP